jgi:sigma-B regulation protein RsbU (phosphoserine phosphatase)
MRLDDGHRVGIGPFTIIVRTGAPMTVVMDDAKSESRTQSVWSARERPALSHQRLERLYDLNERLAGLFDRDELMRELVHVSIESLNLERAGLALWAGQNAPPRWVVVKNLRPDPDGEMRISRTLVDRALRNKERILINDMVRDMPTPTESMIHNHICSAMVVPLIYHDTVHGVLYGDRVSGAGGYTKEDIDFFAALARLAAMGLVNVQLLEEQRNREKFEAQLHLARQIQNRLLPGEPIRLDGLIVTAINEPGRYVSGDYFDYRVRPDGVVTIVIADVSGKGIPAALLMANLQAAVHVTLLDHDDLSRAAMRLNELIYENVDSERFITGIVGLLDPAKRMFRYVNCGHMPPYHLRSDGSMVQLPGTSTLPLGIMIDVKFPVVEYELGSAPSTLFMYTDGVPDAQNDREEFFGETRVRELLSGCTDLAADALIQRVRLSIQQFSRHAPQFDDITMLAIGLS